MRTSLRKIAFLALIALAFAALAVTLTGGLALAQDAPGGPPPGMREGMERPGMMREGPMRQDLMRQGDGHSHGPGGMMRRMREFGLIYPAPDRALSGADVQKIAEAYLLLNGNHAWKVTEVTETPDRVTFALATPDGTAIAHFAMDRHTARPERLN